MCELHVRPVKRAELTCIQKSSICTDGRCKRADTPGTDLCIPAHAPSALLRFQNLILYVHLFPPPPFTSTPSNSREPAFPWFLMPVVRYLGTANWFILFFLICFHTNYFEFWMPDWSVQLPQKKTQTKGWPQKQDLKVLLYLFCPYCSDFQNSRLPEELKT